MVGGQLHDKGGGLTGEGLELLQHDTGDDHSGDADEEGGGGDPGGLAEHGAGKQANDGHFRAAGDEAGGHDGHFPVPVLLNGTGGHDAGDTTAGGHQHGDEALAGQAEAAEDTVHDEGDTGHVAHVLQNSQQEEQHQHLGHKAQHRADTGHNTVHNKAVQPAGDTQRGQDAVKEAGDNLTEQHVVSPVGAHSTDGEGVAAHGDGVDAEHDHREDGQGQDAVGDDLVDLVGDGEAALGSLFLHRLAHHGIDVGVTLVSDDALSVVIQLLLTVGDMFLQMRGQLFVQLQILQNLGVTLKELDGVPPEIPFVHLALNRFLDVGDSVFHAAGEDMGQLASLMALSQGHRFFSGLHATLALQGAHLHHFTAQGRAQLGEVDGVAVLADQVDHVDGHHHRQPQLNELCGEVQVPLDVSAVHDVQNGVGLLVHQIAPGHYFLQGVGGQGINAGQVLNDHILVAPQLALLLFNSDAGPVAHVLVGAGQGIEQGGLATVRIARQRDLEFHSALLSNVSYN